MFDALPTIESACTSGTPAFSIIDRLRVNRATAILVASGPITGSLSFQGSTTLRTFSSRRLRTHHTHPAIASTIPTGSIQIMLLDSVTRIWVGSGSCDPRFLNMPSKIGTTKVTIATTPRIAMTNTMTGYVVADLILPCSSASPW